MAIEGTPAKAASPSRLAPLALPTPGAAAVWQALRCEPAAAVVVEEQPDVALR
jgi:hypothetical protein